jgi:hypothetical protein
MGTEDAEDGDRRDVPEMTRASSNGKTAENVPFVRGGVFPSRNRNWKLEIRGVPYPFVVPGAPGTLFYLGVLLFS